MREQIAAVTIAGGLLFGGCASTQEIQEADQALTRVSASSKKECNLAGGLWDHNGGFGFCKDPVTGLDQRHFDQVAKKQRAADGRMLATSETECQKHGGQWVNDEYGDEFGICQ